MRPLIILLFIFVCARNSPAQGQPSHVVVLLLENRSFDAIVGNPSAPYINSVINNPHTGLLTQSYGLTHPSQPNYLMLFSGSNQGMTNNDIPKNLPFTTLNLGGSLIKKGLTFTGYSEGLPYTGSNDSATVGGYARKHNPWVNWQESNQNGIPSSSNKPFTDFPTDYNQLSTVSFIVPNIFNDMHDGSVSVGDTWIQNNLDGYIKWCINNNSLFVLTFDEDDNTSNNRIATFFTGASINGSQYNQPVTHYNILRTIEDLYQLPYAGASADSSAIRGIWQTALSLNDVTLQATTYSNSVKLTWEDFGDKTSFYTIERSTGNGFSAIATVKTIENITGNYRYSFNDNVIAKEKYYYRVKLIDKAGNYKYSNTVAVSINSSTVNPYAVYPNPAKGLAYLNTTNTPTKKISISLTDAAGRTMKQVTGYIDNAHPFELSLKQLPNGRIWVNVVCNDERTAIPILIKR
jgi:phosphatidylinositol-3-phosphatase